LRVAHVRPAPRANVGILVLIIDFFLFDPALFFPFPRSTKSTSLNGVPLH
jgi:hypothetical protein